MKDQIEAKLSKFFQENYSQKILAVLLFGSVNQKRMHPESDIDIAILFDFRMERSEREKLIYVIYEQMAHLFIIPIDVVNLNDANLILSHQVLTKGKLIFCKDPTRFKIFRDARLIQYIDFKKFMEPYLSKISQKLREL